MKNTAKILGNFLLFGILVSMAPPVMGQSSSDVCAAYCDYLCRHYRQDLQPVELRVVKRNNGEFTFYAGSLRVKNTGDVKVGEAGRTRTLDIDIEDYGEIHPIITGAIEPGESRWIGLGRVNPRSLRRCMRKRVHIDTTKDFGQWGCSVYGNDVQLLQITNGSNPQRVCRVPRATWYD